MHLASSPGSPQVVLVDAVSINQDEAHSYCIFAHGGRLTITLVWTDYPASPSGWFCGVTQFSSVYCLAVGRRTHAAAAASLVVLHLCCCTALQPTRRW